MSAGEARERRERALKQFREYVTGHDSEVASICGATSQIIAERESGTFQFGRVASYSLTLLARSASSQYFMYVVNEEGKPFVKLLSETEATRMKMSMKAAK
jgi:hypothetical protein